MTANTTSRRTPDSAPREDDKRRAALQDAIDEASAESFPASDPPSWTPLQARPPVKNEADFAPGFSAAEMQAIHAENLHGARMVVGLLLGVFTFGLLMYSSIFLWVLISFL